MTLHRPLRVLAALLVVLTAGASVRPLPMARAADLTFTVDSTADSHDASPGDGICADALGQCTLRAAVEEADAQPHGSAIAVDAPAGTYSLTLGTLRLTANSITLRGVLSSTTIISGNNSATIVSISNAARATLIQLTITGGNAGRANGGGLLNQGSAVLRQSAVVGNTAAYGGGIANVFGARLWLDSTTVNSNSVQLTPGGFGGDGGGIANSGALTLTNSTLDGNSASPIAYGGGLDNGSGGGINNGHGGVITLIASTLDDNSAPAGFGGAIASSGAITLIASTLDGNSALYNGGGIDNYLHGTLTLLNSTLDGNTAASDYGGGIDNSGGAMTLTNSTLGGNSAPTGGGIAIFGPVTLRGTIVATSVDGGDCYVGSPLGDSGYNLDSDGSCGLTQPTDITTTNPLLGPLAANGGPTQTLALLPGSPAIDHGGTHASGCPATDQRGRPRPDEARDGGACDMGAYESQGVQ